MSSSTDSSTTSGEKSTIRESAANVDSTDEDRYWSVGQRDRPRSPLVWLVGIPVLLGGFFVPAVVDDSFYLSLMLEGALLSAMGVGIGFLAHRTGLVSLGHGAFYGGSAYCVAFAATHWGWGPGAAGLIGLAAGTILAVAFGAMAVRTPGISFVMLTLALGQALWILVVQTRFRPITGAYDGLPVKYDQSIVGWGRAEITDAGTFWPMAWLVLVITVVSIYFIGRSHFGKVLEAIRENEERARFSGFDTYTPRVLAFVISGIPAAAAGSLFALHATFVSPSLLHWSSSTDVVIAALLGGVTSVFGPIIGVFAFEFARDQFAQGGNILLYTGLGLIAVMVFAPDGLVGIFQRLGRRLHGALSIGK